MGFIGRKSSLAIIISNTVFKSIYWWDSWPIDVWGWGRGVIWSWGRGVIWSWVGNNWSWMGNLYNCWVSNYGVVDNWVMDNGDADDEFFKRSSMAANGGFSSRE